MTISSIFQRNDADTAQLSIPSTSSNSQVDTGQVLTNQPITGLLIPLNYSGFRILLTVNVDATNDTSETFDLLGTCNGTTWSMSQNSVQNTNGVVNITFSINPTTGQIRYSSDDSSTNGFVKRTLQWIVQTL